MGRCDLKFSHSSFGLAWHIMALVVLVENLLPIIWNFTEMENLNSFHYWFDLVHRDYARTPQLNSNFISFHFNFPVECWQRCGLWHGYLCRSTTDETTSLAQTLCAGHMGQWATQGFEGETVGDGFYNHSDFFVAFKLTKPLTDAFCTPSTSNNRSWTVLLKFTKEQILKSTRTQFFGTTKNYRTPRCVHNWNRKA